jgi:hypothetical protein
MFEKRLLSKQVFNNFPSKKLTDAETYSVIPLGTYGTSYY